MRRFHAIEFTESAFVAGDTKEYYYRFLYMEILHAERDDDVDADA